MHGAAPLTVGRSGKLRWLWRQPGFRARMVTAQRKAAAEPGRRRELLDQCARNNADPDVLAKQSAARRAFYTDPENVIRMSAALKRAYSRPDVRARMHRRWRTPRVREIRMVARDCLSAEQKALIVAAVASGERRIMVGVDWLITEARVGQIVRAAQRANEENEREQSKRCRKVA